MYERAVSIALFDAELAERFEIGLAFDVARGAADFGDDDIRARFFRHKTDMIFDFVGYVRHDLHRFAAVFARALFFKHRGIQLAAGKRGIFREVHADKPLVMP